MVALGRLTSSNFPVDRSDWSTLSFTGESVIDLKRLHCNERRKQMFTEDRSLTVRYKLGEVSENEFLSHWNKIKEIYGGSLPEKILWHPELFTGYVLPSYVGGEVLNFVRTLPGVESVTRSKVYRTNSLSWGLDRIDQTNLPLDGHYSPDFNGTGVNVFVVDSGIDTEHIEFKPLKGKRARRVENIFDVSAESVLPNNDGVGHGTHVAGIVGGNTVGVSPGCNIYGVKVLSSNGGGSDFDIVRGLSYVLDMYNMEKKPSIVSMSLGGTCESYEECAKDLLVLAVEKLSSAGIVVVTAAGNSDCDSCLTTPAYAPQGITVGASSITDDAAVFSDFGKCIDIYAPGVEIISACGTAMCPGELNQYKNLSGTSMACPYVSGVVAQLLEGHPTSSVADITTMLSCTASSMVLSIVQDKPPSVTRNLLLKIPKKHLTTTQPSSQPSSAPSEATPSSNPTKPTPPLSPSESSKPSVPTATPSYVPSKAKPSSPTAPASPESPKDRLHWGLESDETDTDMCNLGQGCEQFNYCSNKGICQNGRCLCDALAWGPDCSSVEFGSHCSEVSY